MPTWLVHRLCLAALLFAARSLAAAEEPPLVARPGAHPTLVNPDCSHCVDEAKRRAADLRDDDRVLAWIRGGYEGGAIPLRFFLVPYRVISDTYGVFVFDADAGYARGYAPSLDFEFYGWRGGVLVMRHKDGTLFSALSGRAFAGPRKGERLEPVPTLVTHWGPWQRAYPGTVAYHMYEKYQPIDAPLEPEADSLASRGPVDPRLPAEAEVLGVFLGGQAKAYPLADLEWSFLSDRVGGREVWAVRREPSSWVAYEPVAVDAEDKETKLTLEPPGRPLLGSVKTAAPDQAVLRDQETGSLWDITGRAIEGPLKGQTLRWADSVQCRWFAWAAEYPETELWRPAKRAAALEPTAPAPASPGATPREIALVEPAAVSPQALADWSAEGYRGVALALSESTAANCRAAAELVRKAGLDLHYWVEVGRCPALADEHPEWQASLGMHEDWRSAFPQAPRPTVAEVVKAWPWVPIGYREAFFAHLGRIESLVAGLEPDYRGLLLNDLQGGPASCGCGNLQCRWALDYQVPATAERLPGDDAAARFVAAVERLAPGKEIVPIWTTECQEADLPGGQTGLCGSVPCARGRCPREFARQWTSLTARHRGPIGVLALASAFGRADESNVALLRSYVAQLGKVGAPADGPGLWIVVGGTGRTDSAVAGAREAARELRPAAIVVAQARLDQSYEPRIVSLRTQPTAEPPGSSP